MEGKKIKVIKLKSRENESLKITIFFVKWVFLGGLVGIFTGLVGAFFLKSLEYVTKVRMNTWWILFLLPFGGAFVSWLYYKFGGKSSKGNNLIIEKLNDNEDEVPLRMAPLVLLGTIITHLFGGSAGREGTGVQIGASIAERIGKIFRLDKADSRIILMAGISGGFSSVFGTPIASTIFGMEVAALGSMNYVAILPCFVSSFIGNFVTQTFGVSHSHYSMGVVPKLTFLLLGKVLIIAILFGLTSKLFSMTTHGLKKLFTSRFKNSALKSFIGGLAVIFFTYIIGSREYLGLSLPMLSKAFTNVSSPLDFIIKLFLTSVTLGSGFQGGEVTPLFVIGATLGSFLSSILNAPVSFFAALGLIGVFTGATNTPIAAVFMGIEMFGSDGAIFILMVCIISYLFSGHSGIYTSQLISTSKSSLINIDENSSINSRYTKK